LARFEKQGIVRGNAIRFPAKAATEVILAVAEAGLRVLGVDGFLITETTTQPLMEHSVDFSGGPAACENDIQAALEFVKARESLGLYFEIVLDGCSA
jgi:hypothetical protein